MTRPLPTRCPLCAGRVHVEKIRCEACNCAVEGQFGLDWLGTLSPEHLAFVKVFLIARGKIKDVEQALGISYPTVVSRLEDVVAALGASRAEPEASARSLDVLEELASGDIDINEAERRLRRKK
ncbi:MAG: DUF2089 domain-containing protein [Archangium sp.]